MFYLKTDLPRYRYIIISFPNWVISWKLCYFFYSALLFKEEKNRENCQLLSQLYMVQPLYNLMLKSMLSDYANIFADLPILKTESICIRLTEAVGSNLSHIADCLIRYYCTVWIYSILPIFVLPSHLGE